MEKRRVPLEDLYGAELDDELDFSDYSDHEEYPRASVPAQRRLPEDEEDEEDEEEEEEEEEEEGDLALAEEKAISGRVAAAQASMRDLLLNFTPEQLHRYETFRRVGFNRPAIKKLIQKVYYGEGGAAVNPNSLIIVAGVAKVFTGELVEMARALMDQAGERGAPLTPFYILEAHRRMLATNSLFTPPARSSWL
jgi:transcription initiation factor TFIID subunit 11